MTKLPFGNKAPALKRSTPWAAIGPTFVITSDVGLKCAMFSESLGIIITLPVGPRTPPANMAGGAPEPEAPTWILEYWYDTGLNRPTFEIVCGMNTTFPFGTRTPPQNLVADVGRPVGVTDENRPVPGLKKPTFEALCGTKRTRPSGRRTEPA